VSLLARLDALPDRGAIVVEFEDGGVRRSLILVRSGDRISAFRNKCPHAGYPLNRYLVCAAHGASFTLTDGACAGGPCNGAGLERVEIEMRDGAVHLAPVLPR
jgi:nitrite reductase/ring-hydroxylating ferredoxin subunit